MTLKNPTYYSAVSSLGFHLVFVLVAGSFWLSQADTPPIEKPFRLKVFSKPPVVSKPMPTPQRKQETAKVARVQKMVKPSPVFVNTPRASKPLDAIKTQKVVAHHKTMKARVPSPRTFKPTSNVSTRHRKMVRMAQAHGGEPLVDMGFSTSHMLQPSGPVGRGADGRVAIAYKGLEKIHVSQFEPKALPNIVDREAKGDYLAEIRRKIASAKEYPPEAKNTGQEGNVRVRFTILEDGQVRDLLLVSATPYSILNSEALEMVKRAAPFSRLPRNLGSSALNVLLPFTFQLN